MRSWNAGPHSAVLDEGGVLFDMSGTPMDQDWHCPLERLADHAEVLRQAWPEELLVEIFAEAARLNPDIAPLPPRKPAPPVAPRRVRRPAFRPESLRFGFGGVALAELGTRVNAAARALDPTFPHVGALVLEAFAQDAREERSTYRAGTSTHALVVIVTSEKQAGASAKPISARFEVVGLAPGCALSGTWNGVTVSATPEGPPASCAQALSELQVAPAS